MPRQPAHFKVRTSAQNHGKLSVVFADNDLLALWLRLGLKAVERFADRTGDTFRIADRELVALTGKGRLDVARTLLGRLADVSPISASRDGDVWLIHFPNFAKKQGFRPRNGAITGRSSTSSSPSTSSSEEEHCPAAAPPPGAVAPVSAPKSRQTPPPPEWTGAVAAALRAAVLRRWPGAIVPATLVPWQREIARIRSTPEAIAELVAWYAAPERDGAGGRGLAAYTPEIRAAASLREKWNALLAARERDHRPTRAAREADEAQRIEREALELVRGGRHGGPAGGHDAAADARSLRPGTEAGARRDVP